MPVMEHPFGEDWKYQGAKVGGANRPGEYGGVYKNAKTGEVALFKQDTKHGKVRVAKVAGEVTTGKLLSNISDYLGIDQQQIAQVEFAKVLGDGPQAGNAVYVKSTFITGYQHDLWQYAYQEHYKEQYLENHRTSLLNLGWKEANITRSAELFAHEEVQKMKRPSAVFIMPDHKKVRHIVSKALLANKALKEDFVKQAAIRLLLNDRGLHNGNFGLMIINGEIRLASLDYGAGCCDLNSSSSPWGKQSGKMLYKNHFQEYSLQLSCSMEMAEQLLRVSRIPKEDLEKMVQKSLRDSSGVCEPETQRRFCQRLGMKSRDIEELNSLNISEATQNYTLDCLLKRQGLFHEQALRLAAENSYNHKTKICDPSSVKDFLAKNNVNPEEFQKFLKSPAFEKQPLSLHGGYTEKQQQAIKKQITDTLCKDQPSHTASNATSESAKKYSFTAVLKKQGIFRTQSQSWSPEQPKDDASVQATRSASPRRGA